MNSLASLFVIKAAWFLALFILSHIRDTHFENIV